MNKLLSLLLAMVATAHSLPSHADIGIISDRAMDIYNVLAVEASQLEDQASVYSFKSTGGLRCVVLKSKEVESQIKSYCFLADKPDFKTIYHALNVPESRTQKRTTEQFQKSMKSVGTLLRCSKTTTSEISGVSESYHCFGSFQ
jgi:hypothetical protein